MSMLKLYAVNVTKEQGVKCQRIVGECVVCGHKLGYQAGSNWRNQPIGADYASWYPNHISCPICETDYTAAGFSTWGDTPIHQIDETKAIVCITEPLELKKRAEYHLQIISELDYNNWAEPRRSEANNIKNDIIQNISSFLSTFKPENYTEVELPKTEIILT